MRHEELKKTKSSSGLVLEIQTDEIFQKKKINGPNRPFQNYTVKTYNYILNKYPCIEQYMFDIIA